MKKTLPPLFRLLLPVLFLLPAFNLAAECEEDAAWSLICPPDVTVDCDDEIWYLDMYGSARYHDHRGYHWLKNPTVKYYLNDCNQGYITRTWRVEDPYWNWHTCTQIITVGNGSELKYHHIEWPQKDVVVNGCNPKTDPHYTGKPWVPKSDCSKIGTTYKDEVYTVSKTCKKIVRTWKVMDWCKSNNGWGGNDWNSNNVFTYVQYIKVMHTDVPEFDCPDDVTVESNDCDYGWVDVPPLMVWPGQCYTEFTIKHNSPYAKKQGADISGKYPVGTTKVKYTVEYGCGLTKHCTVNITVKGGKKPTPICIGGLTVALMGIDTNKDGINDEGMVTIWASDLNWKSYPGCGTSPLYFSFSSNIYDRSKTFTCEDIGKNWVTMYVTDKFGNQNYCTTMVEVQNNAAMIENCSPPPPPPPPPPPTDTTDIEVPIDTTDIGDTTIVDPIDTTITSALTLAGYFMNSFDEAVPNAKFMIVDPVLKETYITTIDTIVHEVLDSFIGGGGFYLYFYDTKTTYVTTTDTIVQQEIMHQTSTDEKGYYHFDSCLIEGNDYILMAPNSWSDSSGVDRNDLDFLTSFILGDTTFSSIYEYLAADVNEDGNVDVLDLNLMIQYLKGDVTTFSTNDFKIIYEGSYLDSLPEVALSGKIKDLSIDSITASMMEVNYRLYQLGDITREPASQEAESGGDLDEKLSVRSYTPSEISIHPNPFVENLTLSYSTNQKETIRIIFFDVRGSKVSETQHNVSPGLQKITINTDNFSAGVHFYQVISENETRTGKVIKVE